MMVPKTIPVNVINQGDTCSADGAHILHRPGLEIKFTHPDGNVYFIMIHAIADFDLDGQVGFFQIAKLEEDGIFGDYHYFFATRGGGTDWDRWKVGWDFRRHLPNYFDFANCIETYLERV